MDENSRVTRRKRTMDETNTEPELATTKEEGNDWFGMAGFDDAFRIDFPELKMEVQELELL